jgi:hypothetical protein
MKQGNGMCGAFRQDSSAYSTDKEAGDASRVIQSLHFRQSSFLSSGMIRPLGWMRRNYAEQVDEAIGL